MKKILSIARMDLAAAWRLVILSLAGILVLEGGLMYRAILTAQSVQYEAAESGIQALSWSVSVLVDYSHIPFLFPVIYLLFPLLTTAFSQAGKSRQTYTMARLGLSRGKQLLGHLLYHLGLILIFWNASLLLIFGMIHLYLKMMTAAGVAGLSVRTIAEGFWENELLHALFPAGDILCGLRSLVMILAMAVIPAEALMTEDYINSSFVNILLGVCIMQHITDEFDVFNCVMDCILIAGLAVFCIIGGLRRPSGDLYRKSVDEVPMADMDYRLEEDVDWYSETEGDDMTQNTIEEG